MPTATRATSATAGRRFSIGERFHREGVNLLLRPDESNAPRSCFEYGEDANYHVFQSGVMELFSCEDHQQCDDEHDGRYYW